MPTTVTYQAGNARPDPANDYPAVLAGGVDCLRVNDGDTSYALTNGGDTAPFRSPGVSASGAVLWTPDTPTPAVALATVTAAQLVVVARDPQQGGAFVKLQAGWTTPDGTTGEAVSAGITITGSYATYTINLTPNTLLTAPGSQVFYAGVFGEPGHAMQVAVTSCQLILTGTATALPLRQFPRDDAFGAPRQIPSNPTSVQHSARQRFGGYL